MFTLYLLCFFVCFVLYVGYKVFVVPRSLAHIPRVPILPQLRSYLSGEPEDQRIQRLLLPFANEHGHPIVVTWVFGVWIIHVLDFQIGQATLRDRAWVRQLPSSDLLLWKLVGSANVAFSVGTVWRRHSKIVLNALQGAPPFHDFILVAQKLFRRLGDGTTTVQWDELCQEVALDILGASVLGYDFKALEEPDSIFSKGYREVMHGVMAPPYIFLPFLDRYLPRRDLMRKISELRKTFSDIIAQKRKDPKDDIISQMIVNPEFTPIEVLDNALVLFATGHETSSGGLASLIYYLAKYPDCQTRARDEVLSVLIDGKEPNLDAITRMPYVYACVREAMRMNNPTNGTIPRKADVPTKLGSYAIPANTLMYFDICVVHKLAKSFKAHDTFDPERFMSEQADQVPVAYFGLGLRQCPARSFAMWELRTLGALLLKEYKWKLPTNSPHWERVCNGFSFSSNTNRPRDLDIIMTKL